MKGQICLTVLIAFCVNLIAAVRGGSTIGALSLDSFTFDKVLAKHSQILVKFDESFAFGEKQDVFEQLCNKSAEIPELIIGEVQTSDFGSMKNKDMEKKFGITKGDRPTYRLFLDHSDKPIKYTGSHTIASISNFLYDHIGIRFPLEFTLPKFDTFAIRFMKETEEAAQRAIIDEAEAAKKKLKSKKKKKSADVYVSLMEKIMEKGAEFVAVETKRVDKLMKKKGGMSDSKKENFIARLNILAAFKTVGSAKEEL